MKRYINHFFFIVIVAMAAGFLFGGKAHAHDKPVDPPPVVTPVIPPNNPVPGSSLSRCWHAQDNDGGKDAHIGLSGVLGVASVGVFRNREWYEQIAIAMVPGILKEIKDCRTSGLISRKDLRNDLIGATIGVGLAHGALYLERRGVGATATTSITYVMPLE